MRRIWLGILVVCLMPTLAYADDTAGRVGLGLDFGHMKLIGGEQDYSNTDLNANFHLRRGLASRWSLELSLKYGWIRPGVGNAGEEALLTWDADAALYTVIWQPRAGLLYHLMPERHFSPYLGLSVGATSWKVKDLRGKSDVGLDPFGPTVIGYDEDGVRQELDKTNFTATATLGTDLFLNPNLALGLGARYHQLVGNDLDNVGLSSLWGPENADANDGLVEAFAGFTYFFGSTDADKDGINDRQDACPHDPEDIDGFQDSDGCPDADNDGDGVLDASDGCPNDAEDKDGFQDSDGCPDPDNDGDGVLDTNDQCPDDAEDKDGFQDSDGCPDLDNDGDGVLDANDQCSDTPSGVQVDSHGCPLPKPAAEPIIEIKRGEELVLQGVNFKTASSELTPESSATLDMVARSLEANPEVTIEIQGHTDSSGGAEMNRALSQRRAQAVRDYFVAKGIAASRLTSVGFGEDRPVADNATVEGRTQNRRVEVHRTDK